MPGSPAAAPPSGTEYSVLLAVLASVAVTIPTLIAFNVAPSATFFNQAAAFVGWGAFLLVLGMLMPEQAWPRAPGSRALLAAMAIVLAAALAASLWASVPWSLSLSSAGTIASAVLTIALAAAVQRTGLGVAAFRAFCIALVVAGIASSVIGLVQVFAPHAPDGDWVALASIPGRATGNLRQPNHLSSLLLWSVVAAIWLGEARAPEAPGEAEQRAIASGYAAGALALAIVFIYVVVLTGSRTGALGMLTLAGWGFLDRRLSRRARAALVLAPLIYAVMWWGTSLWATQTHQVFGGQARFSDTGNFSSSRLAIWSNTLALIASHPWFGVGFGEFNFAWTLTPFPGRPTEFFDHCHNLVLNFAAELGVPLALVVLALMIYALWRGFVNAVADGREPGASAPTQRAAIVIVILVAVHSMLEYPLWYSYFLLPTAFAFGLCLERPGASGAASLAPDDMGDVTRPYVIAAMVLILSASLAVYDYMRVVVIFAPPISAGPLEERIADGRRSVLFAHHADYAAATIAEHPGQVMEAFRRAPHYLLDGRLMRAWARAFDERGETDKARHVAARLREFAPDAAEGFFSACASMKAPEPGSFAEASAAAPFQCLAPEHALRFEDFR